MRPGQPPDRIALCMSSSLFISRCADLNPCTMTSQDCSSSRLSSSDACDSTRRSRRQVIPNAHHASLKLLPSIHPRELTEAPALLQSVAFKTSHVCTGDTVLDEGSCRNRKSMLACAQTVEDRISLWKPKENCGVILLMAYLIHVLANVEAFFCQRQHVAFASHPHVKRRQEKNAHDESRDQTSHNNNCKRPLRIGTDGMR